MKNLKYILLSFVLIAAFVACDDDPDGYHVDKGSFCIEAFGPNPVVRGDTLQFVGQKLKSVTSVVLPENVEVISDEFIDFTSQSFKLIVPKECEEGYVTVYYSNNGSVTLTSQLTFSETFEVYSVYALETGKTIFEAGDSVVVTGEYLNNVVTIGFVNGITTDEIGYQTRNELHFAIPKGAVTGLIYCEDSNGYQVYSSEELTIDQPVLSGVSPLTVRPGDNVTISGEMLDQIVSVTFTGASAIESDDFVSVAYSSLVVEVPDDAKDGSLTLVTAAEQTLTTDDAVTIKVPENLSVAAETVFKAGLNVVISGDDLDLVTGVKFYNGVSAEFSYSNGQVIATIPAKAVDGVITLSMASGKTTTTSSITVVKPVITGLSTTEITAGETFTIIGTDLDLVTSVTLNGAACDFTADSSTSLTVTTTSTHFSGAVVVIAANGDTSTYGTELTVNHNTKVTVTSITSAAKVGETVTMVGEDFNLIEAIYFGEVKVTSYSSRTDTQMVFTIPTSVAGGTYYITFVLTDDDSESCVLPIEVTGATTTRVVYEGSWDLGTDWGNSLTSFSWPGPFYYDNIPYGTTFTIECSCYEGRTDGMVGLLNPSGWAVFESWGGSYADIAGLTGWSCELTDDEVDVLNAKGFIVGGYAAIITKIYVTYSND